MSTKPTQKSHGQSESTEGDLALAPTARVEDSIFSQLRRRLPPRVLLAGILVGLGMILTCVVVLASREEPEVAILPPSMTAQLVGGTKILRPSTPTGVPAPTSISSPNPTVDLRLALAAKGVETNGDWIPYFQTFDGVKMALVPAGCFEMGGVSVYSNEAPVDEQCFDATFWIDVSEVSNGQYGASGYFAGASFPRETVSWFEASTFCKARSARLPTEVEWEYAARGPDGLLYPWGGRFEEDMVVYRNNSDGHPRSVDAGVGNRSWVGAVNMSGNVGEWVSSLYRLYPYDARDGREVNGEIDGVNARVIRGGSWWTVYPLDLRGTMRYGSIPTNVSSYVGFRCARSVLTD